MNPSPGDLPLSPHDELHSDCLTWLALARLLDLLPVQLYPRNPGVMPGQHPNLSSMLGSKLDIVNVFSVMHSLDIKLAGIGHHCRFQVRG